MMKRFSGHFVISLNQHSKGVYVPGLMCHHSATNSAEVKAKPDVL